MANEYHPKGMQMWLPKGMRNEVSYPQSDLEELLLVKMPQLVLQSKVIIESGLAKGEEFSNIKCNSLHVMVTKSLYELHTDLYNEGNSPLSTSDTIIRNNLLEDMITKTRRLIVNEIRPDQGDEMKYFAYSIGSLLLSVFTGPIGPVFLIPGIYYMRKERQTRAKEYGADLLEATPIKNYHKAYDAIEGKIHKEILDNTKYIQQFYAK